MPAYNLPVDLLRQCLESIISLSLSKEQREIIVIDDGSDFSPINALGSLVEDIIFIRQPNGGLSAARNTGIRMAQGRFIQFVDGDDFLIQTAYEHCLDIIRYHELVDMVAFCVSDTKSTTLDLSVEGPVTGACYMESHNIQSSACSYIFRRECLGSLRFTTGIIHEDEEFTPQLLLHVKNLYVTKAKAYYYRYRKDSIMHNSSPAHKERRLGDSLTVLLHLQTIAKGYEEGERKNAMSRRVAQYTMDYLVNTIRLTRSYRRLSEAIDVLTEQGLYPLPDSHYTYKYTLFRRLIQKKAGRIMLMTLL